MNLYPTGEERSVAEHSASSLTKISTALKPFAIAAFGAAALVMAGVANAAAAKAKQPVNIRIDPDLNSKVVSVLAQGEKVDVVGQNGEFVQVRTQSGKVGYLKSKFLDMPAAAIAAAPVQATVEEEAPKAAATEAAPAPAKSSATSSAKSSAKSDAAVATAEAGDATQLDAVEVTGTRIVAPGVVSSSPVFSVEAEEISLQQQPEVERVLRLLPITAPNDGQNVNNGTDGAATIDLRGLGPQRNLILINGKRLTPYNIDGLVDTSMIPAALIERIDIVTGGASAVYGSDAISGAINFIMKRDFEGVDLSYNYSLTGDRDGGTKSASAVLGGNIADGRGNVVLALNWSDREGVQLGQRPLGLLGIGTADGANFDSFLAGEGPAAPADGCGGPGAVAAGGSSTTLPTRVSIAGGPALGQFREDGTLGPNCSVFNFNPFNYYQTPQERFGGSVIGRFEVNDKAEAYSRISYGTTRVRQQVAPSGVFGNPYFTPLSNPFISDQARDAIITAAEAGRALASPTVTASNWRDENGNNVVDAEDYLNISYRRRTVELGERFEQFQNSAYQFVIGVQGNIVGNWNYDLSFQRGQSDRTNIRGGYTNVANIGNAIDSVDGVTCANGDSACVPINLFGGFGSITPAMAAYASATALQNQSYTQVITTAVINGLVEAARLPSASRSLALSFGVERRRERGETMPDECLKLAPASCLGGAGGNLLPIKGGFDAEEMFAELILPIADDKPGAQSLDLELGYRYSDYNPSGVNKTWKYGFSWVPFDSMLVRVMQQRAARAPNVGELAAPRTASLTNATVDPCSIENADAIDATLRQRCIDSGMTDAQVGTVEDIVSGQINAFSGTDLNDLPSPEKADTTTVGIVLTPKIAGLRNPVLSIDYYDIDIQDYINEFTAQEVLDGCYSGGQADQCSKIIRVGGTLTLPGSGVELFTTNLDYIRAKGVEVSTSFGFDLGNWGGLKISANLNRYLKQESQSSAQTPVLDCLGFYGTSCASPIPEFRMIQRTIWDIGRFEVSYLWRHLSSVEVERSEAENTFPAFRRIGSFSYLDMTAGYKLTDKISINALVMNLLDKDPPVVGNEAGDTAFNSGNTYPSHYDTLGRVYSVGISANF